MNTDLKPQGMGIVEFLKDRGALPDEPRCNSQYTLELLDVVVVKMRRVYAALKWTHVDGRSAVYCTTYRVNLVPYNFSTNTNIKWDSVEEFYGPYNTDCPIRILDQLTDPWFCVSDFAVCEEMTARAIKWRMQCRAKIQAHEELVKNFSLAPGDLIKLRNTRGDHTYRVTEKMRGRYGWSIQRVTDGVYKRLPLTWKHRVIKLESDDGQVSEN